MKKIINVFFVLASLLFAPVFFLFAIFFSFCVRVFGGNHQNAPKLVWGSTPIINNMYWSRAMKSMGYFSETFTNGFYSKINKREDWDVLIQEKYSKKMPLKLKIIFAFFESLVKYDVFFISFDGFFLGMTPYWWMEGYLLKFAGKKVIVLPYGSDSYVYRRIRSLSLIHALLLSYPGAGSRQRKIARHVDYWCDLADIVFPGFMGPDGFGRWDIFAPSSLHVDLSKWKVSIRESFADGKNGTVFIAHAPNHRGFKGTEFLFDAVRSLKEEGLMVEIVLIEGKQNSEVMHILEHSADILLEQLLFTGHGLNGLEGMASGLPVISNLEDDALLLPFRRWSYFSECPIVSAGPENITDVLRKLVTSPALRHKLGKAGREYVETYHGLDSAQYLFGSVLDYLYGRINSYELLNLYNPRTAEYCHRRPRVEHPLVNNRIVD